MKLDAPTLIEIRCAAITGFIVAAMFGMVHPAHAQAVAASAPASSTVALPLSGAAYRVAQQAYASFAAHDYAASAKQAREAIRQRPDVVSLRLLLANALAASRLYGEASKSLGDAIAQIGPDRELMTRRAQIDALSQSVRAVARNRNKPLKRGAAATLDASGEKPLTGGAFTAAQLAYKRYADKDFAGAAKAAGDAIALRPDVLRLRLLQIDAAAAAGQDVAAFDADQQAVARFGDSEPLRLRRSFIGSRIAPQVSGDALAARTKGDNARAVALLQQAIQYSPDLIGYRIQLMQTLFAMNDLHGVEAAATEGIAHDDTEIMPWTLRGYVRAALGRKDEADADFAKALEQRDATRRDQATARAIVADTWTAQGQPQRALDMLAPVKHAGDDTDSIIASRRHRARHALDDGSPAIANIDPSVRPVIDCGVSQFGALCTVYPSDPGFAETQAAILATSAHDKKGRIAHARKAVDAAPDDPQHRVELINALVDDHQDDAAVAESKATVRAGLLDGMTPMDAAYIASRAGDSRGAYRYFSEADRAGDVPSSATGDVAYAAVNAHENKDAARYLERAIDTGITPADGDTAATPEQLANYRATHADVTRNWGFNVSANYRSGSLQPGFATTPAQGTSNNWQAGAEAYWRPFGSLNDRMFELYTRGYESFDVKGGGPSGLSTLEDVIGARVKPFASVDTVFAFEHIFPLGSQVRNDWLARIAYSGGIGTERRLDQPSWWTVQGYAEGGHYLNASTSYMTANIEAGRTYRVDRISPKLTVFPFAVIGADYDSSVDHSIPVGAGAGITARYWMRDSKYDAPRSFVDVSVQYRLHVTGDDRSRGVFFGAIYSY